MDRHEVAHTGELADGSGKIVRVRGAEVGLFRVGGEYRAYLNLCPHAGAPLCTGGVGGTVTVPEGESQSAPILRCPWHGWEFNLRTGAHVFNPACRLQSYTVEVEGEAVFVLA